MLNLFTRAVAGGAFVRLLGGAAADSTPVAVEINNFAFEPRDVTIERGATVQWTNHDTEPHTVVSSADPKAFRSPPLDTGDTYAFVFKEPGTYRYFCSIHPHMVATITVK